MLVFDLVTPRGQLRAWLAVVITFASARAAAQAQSAEVPAAPDAPAPVAEEHAEELGAVVISALSFTRPSATIRTPSYT